MLVKLVAALRPKRCNFLVVSLRDVGTQAQPLRELGAVVEQLHMNRPWHLPAFVPRLRRLITHFAPDVIQGWMYHGNLAATLGMRWAPSDALLMWGIRQTFHGMANERPLTRLVIRANARLSERPGHIVFNSTSSLDQHAAIGFRKERAKMIPNGFELDRFRPDASVRARCRAWLGVSPDTLVVGHVARDHPMKDHETLLLAARQVVRSSPNALFVLVGTGVDESNSRLAGLVRQFELGRNVRFLGEVFQLENLYPAFDLCVLSSAWGEAFPNVLGEAMACGVPCIATDVGEAGTIIGDQHRVVDPSKPDALAHAIRQVLEMDPLQRCHLGASDRERVVARYALDRIADEYWRLYSDARGIRPKG